jgi:hypothetical protein
VEFWQNGKPITHAEALSIAQANGIDLSELKWWPAGFNET